MSTIKDQTELGGMLGENVSVRKVNGRVILTNRPKRKMGEATADQIRVKDRFAAASRYAKRQMAQDSLRSMYAKGVKTKKQSPYAVAVADFLVVPRVTMIRTDDYHGAIGDRLIIEAVDDFQVTKVKVVITNAAGVTIEQGEAGVSNDEVHEWQYTTSVANLTLAGTKILAIAYDRPGNTGRLEVVV